MPARLTIAALLLLILPSGLAAQSAQGSISGIVTDPTGAAITGAAVVVRDIERNVTFKGETNASGLYVVTPLPPGNYEVAVEAKGFRRWVLEGFPLSTQQKASVDVQLQIGSLTESVQVTAEAQMIEPGSSTLSTVVENKKIMDLPLNGRNVFQLALLAPGIAGWQPAQSTGGIAEGFESTGRFLVSGGRESSNAILLDGVAVNSNGQAPGYEFTTGLPSAEGIQEFRVQTNAYSAEFGRAGGGMLTLTTKSGTNELHGSLFEFLRNSKMDANSWFSNAAGQRLGSFKRNEFGGAAGGPVYLPKLYNGKNRTFFFANYEGRRVRGAALARQTVPSALERAGDFSGTRNATGALRVIYDPLTTVPDPGRPGNHIRTPFTGNRIPQARLNPISMKTASYYPQGNAPGDPFTRQFNYVIQAASKGSTNRYTAKVDHVLSEKHRVFFRYTGTVSTGDQPEIWPGNPGCPDPYCYSAETTQKNAAVEWTSLLNPGTILTLRYGVGYGLLDRGSWHRGFRPSSLGFPAYMEEGADLLLFPQFAIDDVTPPGLQHHWNYKSSTMVHNVMGSLTRVFGSHTVKAGTEARLNRFNYMQAAWSAQFNFGRTMSQGPDPRVPSLTGGHGFATFLLGAATGGQLVRRTRPATANEYVGFYVQDDWKITRKLTLNLGLRWDIENGFTERWDRFAVFDPLVRSPLSERVGQDLRGGYRFPGKGIDGRRIHPTEWGQFNPRIGLAYQWDARTVVRAGYGIFYNSATFGARGGLGQGPMYAATTPFLASLDGITPYRSINDPFPDGLVPIEGATNGLLAAAGQAAGVPVIDHMLTPYNQQWNFTIQRSLWKDTALEAAYAGNKGTHLPLPWSLDQLHPSLMSPANGLLDLVPNPYFGILTVGALSQRTVQRGQLLTPFPHYPGVTPPANGWGNSSYHALQMRLERRFSGGTSVMAAYTFSKTISDSGDDMWLDTPVRNNYCRACEKALSGYDQRHRLVVSFTYELPAGRGKKLGADWNRWLDGALGGWQLNGIGSLNSALPLGFGVVQNTSFSFGGGQFPDSTGKRADLPASERTLARWFDIAQFQLPQPYTFGTLGRTHPTLRADRVESLDFSIFKSFRVWEGARVQFRAESFNAFNHPVFAAPNTNVGAVNFGRVNGQANAPRQLQMALKLVF